MSFNPLSERSFQEHVIKSLTAPGSQWVRGSDSKVDRKTGLYPEASIAFIQATQPEVWDAYVAKYGPNAGTELTVTIAKALAKFGTLALLRSGIPRDFPGLPAGINGTIRMSYPKPNSGKNKDLMSKCQANIFTIAEEVHFEAGTPNPKLRLDLGGWLNGVPLLTCELKNEVTGQNHHYAENQYKSDSRNPAEPLLRNGTGALVHLAIGNAEASFTTRLKLRKTQFYPLNKGFENGAGNNPEDFDEQGFRTHYIWNEILQPDSLLDIIYNFLHIEYSAYESSSDVNAGTLIFPRYHQYQLLRKIREDLVGSNPTPGYGIGKPFLIQHSAGSGKTKSIAALVHLLADLHTSKDASAFDVSFVITDRRVVDAQLQSAVNGVSLLKGRVGVVTEGSKQLADFIEQGYRIIVCTSQKFLYIKEAIKNSTTGKKSIALVIDEAHSGQTGQTAAATQEILQELTDRGNAEDFSVLDDIAQDSSLRKANITLFAFTATPRKETLEKFSPDGRPYDLYSMKQAIDEKFILNPLENWCSHHLINQLTWSGRNIQIDSTSEGHKALKQKVRASEENIRYKATVTLDHMVDSTLTRLKGEGRGMVTVSSRAEVLLWLRMIEELQAESPKRYDAVKPIVAFTGSLHEAGQDHTEESLNGFPSSEIPRRFRGAYNLLIVANKFQTGFDEPNLCSMYVDRKLEGITAVQTLSRLNRAKSGKTTSVIDFRDNAALVRKAFADFQVESRIDAPRVVTQEDLAITARQVYAYGLFTEQEAIEYSAARKTLNADETNEEAARTARTIVLKIGDRIGRLQADTARLGLFKSTAKDFIADYIFFQQFNRITDKRLKALRSVLGIVLMQVSQPRLRDNEWTEQVEIEMTSADIENIDFSDLSEDDRSRQMDREEPVTGNRPLDVPTTLAELVAEWNASIESVLRRSPIILKGQAHRAGASEADLPTWVSQSSDYAEHVEILTRVATAVADNEGIKNLIQGRSFDRLMESEEAQTLAHKQVLAVLRKKENRTDAGIDLMSAYSHEEEVQREVRTFALAWAYQQQTNQNLENDL